MYIINHATQTAQFNWAVCVAWLISIGAINRAAMSSRPSVHSPGIGNGISHMWVYLFSSIHVVARWYPATAVFTVAVPTESTRLGVAGVVRALSPPPPPPSPQLPHPLSVGPFRLRLDLCKVPTNRIDGDDGASTRLQQPPSPWQPGIKWSTMVKSRDSAVCWLRWDRCVDSKGCCCRCTWCCVTAPLASNGRRYDSSSVIVSVTRLFGDTGLDVLVNGRRLFSWFSCFLLPRQWWIRLALRV